MTPEQLPRKSNFPERSEQMKAWELRSFWALRRPVVLALSERCMVPRIEGRVERVAVTGAFVVVNGWHVPVEEILAIARPHHTQQQEAEAA